MEIVSQIDEIHNKIVCWNCNKKEQKFFNTDVVLRR